MIKKLRVTVDGNTYDVTVELPDEAAVPAPAAPVSTAPSPLPAATPPPTPSVAPTAPSPAPVSAPGVAGPGAVPSPLAGRVTAIVVQARQEVKEGDHLL